MDIATERLAGNFQALSAILREEAGLEPAPALLAVVKANAYGHGIDACAGCLVVAGAEWLGVTDAHEGAQVRAALRGRFVEGTESTSQRQDVGHLVYSGSERRGVQPQILVMSGTVELQGEAECIIENGLTTVAWELSHVARLGAAARLTGQDATVPVHLEVDTGMSRQGVAPGAALDRVLRAIAAERRVKLDGVFTHFASTEVAGSEQTPMQQAAFEAAVAQIVDFGMRPRWMHAGNSSYIDNAVAAIDNPGTGQDALRWVVQVAGRVGARPMVRSGLGLYGYLLPIEGPGESRARAKVLPVMTWMTRVIGVRDVPAGSLVGYDGAYKAARPMRLALLPLGYADGLRRELSSTDGKAGGWVVIHGQRAWIVGRVSMNLTTVDVSGIEGVVEGDEVVVLGDGVSADDHARVAGTIAYEILCGVKTRQ